MGVKKDSQSRTTVLYYEGVDSDGLRARYDFSQLILRTGKKTQYQRAHEWCCGHGAIGFQLLEDGLCKTLVLTDKHEPAVIGCQFTVAANNLDNVVTVYQNDDIGQLPKYERWDLFVANPPWRSHLKSGPSMSDNDQRIKVDKDWDCHNQLWSSIGQYLTQDADVYMYEDLRFSNQYTWKDQIEQAGLKIHAIYDQFNVVPERDTNYVMHLKKID
jgi:methylase of polypeptide subunit release factors